jgi:hypothetical protein
MKWLLLSAIIAGLWTYSVASVEKGLKQKAVVFYVAVNGNNSWSGRLPSHNYAKTDGPFATLNRALEAVKTLKEAQGGTLRQPVTIYLRDGTYLLTEPIILTPEYSGSEENPVTIAAYRNEKPILSGGRKIRGWRAETINGKKVWVAEIPEAREGKWYFEQLWVNGRRAIRARSPNKFWFYIQDVKEEPAPPNSEKEAVQTIYLAPEDFANIANLSSEEIKDVNIVVHHNWDNTRRFIDKLDIEKHAIITSGRKMEPWNPMRKDSTIIIENFFSALDAPGEWFLARNGLLYYIPRPGEDMTKAEVIAPISEKFLVIKGDISRGNFVENISFKGLRFYYAQWLTPPSGFEPIQAAATIDAVIQVDGARHIAFENCEVGHIGTYAIWFRKGCSDCLIRRCYLFDLGAGGVRIGEDRRPQTPNEATSRNIVDNCIIREGGRVFPCAVGIWVGQSGDNQITHNEVTDLLYTGISVGWNWSYGENDHQRNLIAYNHIHHLGWRVLSDLSGIYTLGESPGTTIYGNVIHDIYCYSYGGWGLGLDQATSYIRVENNLVYNTQSSGLGLHFGKNNLFRNNIFVNCAQDGGGPIQLGRAEDHLQFIFENNIIYWQKGPAIAGPWDKATFISRNNCWWNASGEPATFSGKSFDEWQKLGKEEGSIVADPLFRDVAKGDFHLKPNSPALKIGFKPFDWTKAGVYGSPAWIAKAKEMSYPPNYPPTEPLPPKP